jgi:hypothetical protein
MVLSLAIEVVRQGEKKPDNAIAFTPPSLFVDAKDFV